MNTINRVAIVLLLLLLMVAVSLGLIVPQMVLPAAIRTLQGVIAVSDGFGRLALVLGAVLFDLVLLFLIFLEVRPRRVRMIQVEKATGGTVRLDMESISDRIAYQIDQLSDIVSVKPTVRSRRNGVEILLDVTTVPDVDVPGKAQEIIERTQTVVTDNMGLKLASTPQVHFRIAPMPNSKGKATPAQRRL